MATNFPDEVIREILSWVPVNSLIRFKCVSKTWLHLLTNDPHFTKLHFNRSLQVTEDTNKAILVSREVRIGKTEFYYAEESKLVRFEIPFQRSVPYTSLGILRYNLVNICNGLLCLNDWFKADYINVYVWNPLTRDHITIPSSPIPSHFQEEDGSLCRKTDIMFGFGFNQASDEYKVIRFVSTSDFEFVDEFHSHVSVYTLGTSLAWRSLQQSVPYNFSILNSSTALVNGALHWFGYKLNGYVGLDQYKTLIAFNLQDELFKEIPQPDGITHGYPLEVIVGELRGLLCIFCRIQHESLEVWVMEEYGVADSWRKLCKIEQPDDSGHLSTPFSVVDNGEIVISKNTSEWISYDLDNYSVRDLHKLDELYGTYTFKGSLLSPTIINGKSQPHD